MRAAARATVVATPNLNPCFHLRKSDASQTISCRGTRHWLQNLATKEDEAILIELNDGCDLALLSLSAGRTLMLTAWSQLVSKDLTFCNRSMVLAGGLWNGACCASWHAAYLDNNRSRYKAMIAYQSHTLRRSRPRSHVSWILDIPKQPSMRGSTSGEQSYACRSRP